jgi:hypothetical protein
MLTLTAGGKSVKKALILGISMFRCGSLWRLHPLEQGLP